MACTGGGDKSAVVVGVFVVVVVNIPRIDQGIERCGIASLQRRVDGQWSTVNCQLYECACVCLCSLEHEYEPLVPETRAGGSSREPSNLPAYHNTAQHCAGRDSARENGRPAIAELRVAVSVPHLQAFHHCGFVQEEHATSPLAQGTVSQRGL